MAKHQPASVEPSPAPTGPRVHAVWFLGEHRGIPTDSLSFISGFLKASDGWEFDATQPNYVAASKLTGKGTRVTLQVPRAIAMVELIEEV